MNRGQSLNRPPNSLQTNLKEQLENSLVSGKNSTNISNNESRSLRQNRQPISRIGRFVTTLGQGMRGIRNRISNRFRQPERNLAPSKRKRRNWLNNKKIMNNTKNTRNRIYRENLIERIKQLKMMIGFTEEQSQKRVDFCDICMKFIENDYSYKKEIALEECLNIIKSIHPGIEVDYMQECIKNALYFVPNIIKYLVIDDTPNIFYKIQEMYHTEDKDKYKGNIIVLGSVPKDDLTQINIKPSETSQINPNGHFDESFENVATEKLGKMFSLLYVNYNYIPNGHLKGDIYIPYRTVKNSENKNFVEFLGNTDNKYLINDKNDGILYYMLHGIRYNLIIIKNTKSSNSLDKISVMSQLKSALKDIGFSNDDLIEQVLIEVKTKFLDINGLHSDKLEYAFTHYEKINSAFSLLYDDKDKGMVDEFISQRTAKLKYEALKIIGFNDDEVSEILEMSRINQVKNKFLNENSIDSTLVESALKYIFSNKYKYRDIDRLIKYRRMKIEQMKSRSVTTSTNVQKKNNLNKLVNGKNKTTKGSRHTIL